MENFNQRVIQLDAFIKKWSQEHNLNKTLFTYAQIEALAKRHIHFLDDLLAIEGIGQKTVDLIGKDLLEFIRTLDQEPLSQGNLQNVLSQLSKKLVNLSQANPLLNLDKLTKRYLDMSFLSQALLKDLLFSSKKIIVGSLGDIASQEEKYRFQAFVRLRDLNQAKLKEDPSSSLYLASPFVMGTFLNHPFEVIAPLALFPISLEVQGQNIFMQVDNNQDILINHSLLVAKQNIQNKNLDPEDPDWSDLSKDNFLEKIQATYQSFDLDLLASPSQDFQSFDPSLLKKDCLQIFPFVVAGFFPLVSGVIAKDYLALEKMTHWPDHVQDLLSGLDNQESQEIKELTPLSFRHDQVCLINHTNHFSLLAQLYTKKKTSLTLFGPPGTGKSETISNILGQGVKDQKHMLFASQKKAALDVVYQRLKDLKGAALMVDSLQNKQFFYDQVKSTLEGPLASHNRDQVSSRLDQVNKDMDQIIQLLSDIQAKQEDLNLFGLRPFKLKLTDPSDFDRVKFLKSDPSFLDFTPDQLDEDLANYELRQKIPYYDLFKDNLSDFDRQALLNQLDDLQEPLNRLSKAKGLSKLFVGSERKYVEEILEPYFTHVPSFDQLSTDSLRYALQHYDQLKKLFKPDKDWIGPFIQFQHHFHLDRNQATDFILDYQNFEILETIKMDHPHLLDHIHQIEILQRQYWALLNEKKDLDLLLLVYDHKQKVQQLSRQASYKEMLRICQNQRKWSLAKFVHRFYNELCDLFPIWIMSVETISSLLPMRLQLFDLLVFDEASQIYIEDSVPALARAKQVVIVGDNKQLRPQRLGTIRYDVDNQDNQEDVIAVLEEDSLLDVALYKLPSLQLNYHYRCQYEELIAFSNAYFYNNDLLVAPNPIQSSKPPIEVIKVDGQWQNQANPIESKRVIRLLKEIILTRKKGESIGILTFNAKQKQQIEEDLLANAKQDPTFLSLLQEELHRDQEPLFIKNIENVQGDERDILIFSLAYGFNDQGQVTSFFGWLSQQGGQNRLNVAISRAKSKIYLVTSIDPTDLSVANSRYPGPRLLQTYLAYGQAVSQNQIDQARFLLNLDKHENQDLDPRISTVKNALEAQGYITKTRVGLKGLLIDLAVYDQNHQLIKGLEFDFNHQDKATILQKDIHDPLYMALRGWPVQRIHTIDLVNNFDQVISSILDVEKKED